MKRITLVTMLLSLLCFGACKEAAKEPKPPTAKKKSPAQLLLDQAIEAAGGLVKLKAASSFTGKSEMRFSGVPVETTFWYKPGRSRTDYTALLGYPFTRVESSDDCWEKRGWPVIPCAASMRKSVSGFHWLVRASLLWPLKEETGWTLTAGTAKQGDTQRDSLTVKQGDLQGTLLFDKRSHLLVGLSKPGSFFGMAGKMEIQMSEHQQRCGVQMATRNRVSFAGIPFVEEQVTSLECQSVSDELFKRPPQIKDGTVVSKKLPASQAVCLTHKGALEGLRPKVGQMFGFLMKSQAPMFARGIIIHKKGPPQVKDPALFETEVCIRLARALPDKPGDYVARELKAVEVLAAYGIGPVGEKTPELMALLKAEAQKRKREPAGPLRRIMHMDSSGFPPDQIVSELQLPLK